VRALGAVAGKELRQILRDPLTLVMLLGLPAFMLVIFGYAISFDVEHVALGVQDRDLSAESRALVDAFVASGRFDLVATIPAGADPKAEIASRRIRAALVVPERFGRDIAAGRDARVQLLIDGTDSNTATTLLGYAQAIVAERNGEILSRALTTVGAGAALAAAISLSPRVWYNPELRSSHFLVPGLIGFILMIVGVLSTALSVVREKERGTLEQIRVAPVGTLSLLVGKTLPYLAIALLATVVILVAARLLFGVEVRGSYLDLFAATLLFLAGGFALGLLISTVARTQAIAFQLGVMAALLPTLLLSGFIFPIRNMPWILQALTHVIPARYYLVVLRGVILKGAGLRPYWDELAWLAGYTALVVGLAAVRAARKGV
jgi:ABC-2 type transport system permease protein